MDIVFLVPISGLNDPKPSYERERKEKVYLLNAKQIKYWIRLNLAKWYCRFVMVRNGELIMEYKLEKCRYSKQESIIL